MSHNGALKKSDFFKQKPTTKLQSKKSHLKLNAFCKRFSIEILKKKSEHLKDL